MSRIRKPASPFRYLNSSQEIIWLVVMMYMRFPLSLRNVEDLLLERGIDICHVTLRFRQMKSLQTFASAHANVHNHFNLDRHLTDRQPFKAACSAELAEWQNLMA